MIHFIYYIYISPYLFNIYFYLTSIDHKQKEMNIFDKATSEIEQNYGHIIYSPDFFANEEASEN